MVCNDTKPFVGGHFLQMCLTKDDADPLNNLMFPTSSHDYSKIETKRQNAAVKRPVKNLSTFDNFLSCLPSLSFHCLERRNGELQN